MGGRCSLYRWGLGSGQEAPARGRLGSATASATAQGSLARRASAGLLHTMFVLGRGGLAPVSLWGPRDQPCRILCAESTSCLFSSDTGTGPT